MLGSNLHSNFLKDKNNGAIKTKYRKYYNNLGLSSVTNNMKLWKTIRLLFPKKLEYRDKITLDE